MVKINKRDNDFYQIKDYFAESIAIWADMNKLRINKEQIVHLAEVLGSSYVLWIDNPAKHRDLPNLIEEK